MRMVAIDLGKLSFHVHGVDDDGVIVSRKVSRTKLETVVDELNPEIVAMEACATAHHWGRTFEAAGRHVLLINPRFVKAFARGSKNDAVDAEAIFDAASRPTMRFVPVKTLWQQDLQSLHRVRDRLVAQRTSLINHSRGLLAEYGVVLPKGAKRFASQARFVVEEAPLSPLARDLFKLLLAQRAMVQNQIDELNRRIVALCRENETCRRLSELPGVGPLIATALVASVADGRRFASGRALAAWIGLVPRQYSTGGKPRLGGIGRRANHYLRKQLVHGARSVSYRLGERHDAGSRWFSALIERRGINKAVVAFANKTVRIAWAMLNRSEPYLAR